MENFNLKANLCRWKQSNILATQAVCAVLTQLFMELTKLHPYTLS